RLIALETYTGRCDDDYGRTLEAARESRVTAATLACLSRFPADRVADDYLGSLDLSDPDSEHAARKWRNAVSLLASFGEPVVERLCARLSDTSPDVRDVAAHALAYIGGVRGAECIADSLATGGAVAQSVSGAWPLALARSALKNDRAWELEQRLLADPDPIARQAALGSLSLFNPDAADKVLTPHLSDADPAVKAAAERAREGIEDARR